MEVEPIGFVQCRRRQPEDDYWGGEQACISLTADFSAHALQGLEEFSHIEVLFVFHQVDPGGVVTGARHPRNNPTWPSVGIFAQRARNRPNRLGTTLCRIVRVAGTMVTAGLIFRKVGLPPVGRRVH